MRQNVNHELSYAEFSFAMKTARRVQTQISTALNLSIGDPVLKWNSY